jgi:hypothetical protein
MTTLPHEKRKDSVSAELDDYSGPFRPDLKLTDFSKVGVIKFVEIAAAVYGAVEHNWYKQVERRYGHKVTEEIEHDVWYGDGGVADVKNQVISTLMGFSHQTDVTVPLKINQLFPAMAVRMKLVFEQQGEHEWLMKAQECLVPEDAEASGPEVLRKQCKQICHHTELFGFRWTARRWNPNIRVDPVKLPPRTSAEEPHCCWRYRLEDPPVDYAAEPGELVVKIGLQRDQDERAAGIGEPRPVSAVQFPACWHT